jgi:DNA polymerase/3'-5' exonuclease PolX
MPKRKYTIGQLVRTWYEVKPVFGVDELAFVAEQASGGGRYRIAQGERTAWVDEQDIALVAPIADATFRWPLAIASVLADEVAELLAPACERIEIAGSIRRGKTDVGDIEILCVPRRHVVHDLFGEDTGLARNELEELCASLLADERLEYRLKADGTRAGWGARNKFGWFFSTSGAAIKLDIFAVHPDDGESWGVASVIRTGPADFNRALITPFEQSGKFLPAGWRVQVRDWTVRDAGGEIVPTPNEEEFFDVLGLPFISPEERTALRLRKERAA